MRQERKGHKLTVLALVLALVVGLGVALLPLPAYADPDPGWYNASWAYRKQITFTSDTSKIPSTQSYFPVLINLSSDTDLAADAQGDGDDILFTSSDGTTQLDHEIEKFNDSTGELVAWVEVPSLSTGTVIYMYYGNATCDSQEDVEGTWDGGTDTSPANNFKMVQHLEETSGTQYDSTSNNNDGTQSGGVNQDATGQINGADGFDGTDDHIQVVDSDSLDITTAITLEAWIKTNSTTTAQQAVSKWSELDPKDERSYRLGLNGSNQVVFAVSQDAKEGKVDSVTGNSSVGTEWCHIAGIFNGSSLKVYLNGVEDGSDAWDYPGTPYFYAGTALLRIARMSDVTTEYFNGVIDEVRVSASVRGGDWIKTCYENQNDPSTFYDVGHEEEKPCASCQRWYLSSTTASKVMYKGDHTKTAGTVTVGDDSSEIWIANEASTTNVGFPANTWTGHITFDAGSSDTTVRVYVGKWDGLYFTPSGDNEFADVSDSSDFSISAGAFDVPKDKWLACKIWDYDAVADSNSVMVSVGLNYSYLTSGASDPGYPIPELPTIILIGAGLACLGGYVAFMRRKRRSVSP